MRLASHQVSFRGPRFVGQEQPPPGHWTLVGQASGTTSHAEELASVPGDGDHHTWKMEPPAKDMAVYAVTYVVFNLGRGGAAGGGDGGRAVWGILLRSTGFIQPILGRRVGRAHPGGGQILATKTSAHRKQHSRAPSPHWKGCKYRSRAKLSCLVLH